MAAIVAWPLERNRGNYEQSDTRDMWAAPPEEGGGGGLKGVGLGALRQMSCSPEF